MVKRGRKGQLTVFIIVAILIVVAIILFFLLRSEKVTDIINPSLPKPQQEARGCVEDNIGKAIELMLPHGGYINVSNYKLYEGTKIEYLCYTNQYYYPCTNQEPLYIKHLEEEIHDYSKPKIKACFDNLIQEYRDRKYNINEKPLSLDIELGPDQVEATINKKLDMSKGDKSISYREGKYRVNSPLYNLGVVAQEIASQEAKFCNFEYLGYSLLYPSISIEKDQVGSGPTISDIYKIRDKTTNKTLNIAIRSCAMPGGL